MARRRSDPWFVRGVLLLAVFAMPVTVLMLLRLMGCWRGNAMEAAVLAVVVTALLYPEIKHAGRLIARRLLPSEGKHKGDSDDPPMAAVRVPAGPKSPTPLVAYARRNQTL
jgi:hypothetical protein